MITEQVRRDHENSRRDHGSSGPCSHCSMPQETALKAMKPYFDVDVSPHDTKMIQGQWHTAPFLQSTASI